MTLSMVLASVATFTLLPLIFWLIVWDARTWHRRHERMAARIRRASEDAQRMKELRAKVRQDMLILALSAHADFTVATRPIPERIDTFLRAVV